eukprot:6656575-Prymnesium_polylepis.2
MERLLMRHASAITHRLITVLRNDQRCSVGGGACGLASMRLFRCDVITLQAMRLVIVRYAHSSAVEADEHPLHGC